MSGTAPPSPRNVLLSRGARPFPRSKSRRARVIGIMVVSAGVVNLVSALTPELRERLEIVDAAFTPGVTDLAAVATVALGVALVLLGRGLVRRRRVAYVAAAVALAVSAVTHLVKGVDAEEAVISLAVLCGLVANRRCFTVGASPERARRLAVVVPSVLGATVVFGMVGLYLHRRSIRGLTFARGVREITERLVGLAGPLHLPRSVIWIPASMTAVGGLALLATVVLLSAPAAERRRPRASEHERVAAMTQRPDGDTLDPFALRRDKSYVWSPDRRAAVAYRYVNGVGLASGDPVGEPDAFPGAIAAFLDVCDAHGWRPAVIGVRDDRLPLYESVEMRAHYLGDEAVIVVDGFTLEGRAMRPVRQAYNRVRNFGLTTEIHREGELPDALLLQLHDLAVRARHGAPERGFSMALDGLMTRRDPENVVVVTRDADGRPLAFQRYVPCRGGLGLSLDAMRRERRGPNGVNERMICDAVLWGRDHGVEEVSLNFAFFRAWLDPCARLSALQSFEAWVVRRLSPYFQIESLSTFNAKFHPRWVARHLVVRSFADLATVTIAALSAESFLPFDRHREPAAA